MTVKLWLKRKPNNQCDTRGAADRVCRWKINRRRAAIAVVYLANVWPTFSYLTEYDMPDRFDAWIASLDDSQRQYYADELATWAIDQRSRGVDLANTLEKMGCLDPEGWAFSEVSENIAQVLRFAFLMGVRKEIEHNAKFGIDGLADDNPALAAVITKIQAAVSKDEMCAFLAAFGRQLTNDIMHMIDQGCSSSVVEPGSVWALLEVDDDCVPTGREVGGLHESAEDHEFLPNV
jgi:hypothetical protein